MNCRRASRILSERCERPLGRFERIQLTTHLVVCTQCRRFRRDLLRLARLVRMAMPGWAERRERVRARLRNTGA